MRLLLLFLLTLSTPVMALEGWLLNGKGVSSPYGIYSLDASAKMTNNPTLIISPSTPMVGVYWPSGIRVGNSNYVYATYADADDVLRIGLWKSSGGSYTFHGTVLTPNQQEIRLGAQSVLYDPLDTAAPFKMWYGAGGVVRPNSILYATSLDGESWTRRATILVDNNPSAAHGLQLDFVCRDAGVWRIFYTASADAENRWEAFEASSSTPDAGFIRRGSILRPEGSEIAISTNVQLGTRYLETSEPSAGLVPGHPYVLSDGVQSQRIVVEGLLGVSGFSLQSPVHVAGSGFSVRPIDMKKTGISAFYRQPDGTGYGFATGWGAFSTVMNEYVYRVREIPGGFERAPRMDMPFIPTGPGSQVSFENPSPILTGPDCPIFQ